MKKLLDNMNANLELNFVPEMMRESILEVKRDLKISTVKSLNNDYFAMFSSIENDGSEAYSQLKDFFMECNGLYNEWVESKRMFEDKTMRMIEEKKKIGIDFLTEEEVKNITEVFYKDDQNIYESIEFLSKSELIDKLTRSYNNKLVKENMHILFQ